MRIHRIVVSFRGQQALVIVDRQQGSGKKDRAMRLIAAGNAEAVKDEEPTDGNSSAAEDDADATTEEGVKRGRRKRNVE